MTDSHCPTDLLLEEDLSLRDVAQQELHGDAELGHVLLEARRRVLGSLPARLQEVTVGLGVCQLDSLYTTQVVVVPSREEGQVGSNIRDATYLAHSLLLACSGKVDFRTNLSAWL